jgi:hypothetical protein
MPIVEPACVCHLVRREGCRQGRACPVRESEMAHGTPPSENFPTPKGKKTVNFRSSAYTGRFPRTMADAFGCSPRDIVHPMPVTERGLLDPIGRAANAAARFVVRQLARLFGR